MVFLPCIIGFYFFLHKFDCLINILISPAHHFTFFLTPSYDDLFEREGGVCDKTGQVYENGEPYGNLGWNKIEVYLNLHREGYLQCPEADRVQTPTGTACPTQAYYDSLNTCNGECDNNRNLENNAPPTSADDFYTTDSYFGGKNDICTNDVRSIFKYSKFLADATVSLRKMDC